MMSLQKQLTISRIMLGKEALGVFTMWQLITYIQLMFIPLFAPLLLLYSCHQMKSCTKAYKANVICPNKHQSDKEKFYSNHLLEILALYRFWWGGFWKLDQHFLEPRDYSLYYSFLDHNCFHSSSLETRTSPTKKAKPPLRSQHRLWPIEDP
ncbi:uncharacterized protein LOC130935519 isoform X5 [Arachis stenosperma]|uniref:uncharacterized protein LOC130935519 isoform X5 n=1 Tax=Arachis stenosperma TaxID=217475 RepID=UPI0025AD392B|nr:uncharacterized protein LOC130935519 isoform X5 [Arachis stenosperma]